MVSDLKTAVPRYGQLGGGELRLQCRVGLRRTQDGERTHRLEAAVPGYEGVNTVP